MPRFDELTTDGNYTPKQQDMFSSVTTVPVKLIGQIFRSTNATQELETMADQYDDVSSDFDSVNFSTDTDYVTGSEVSVLAVVMNPADYDHSYSGTGATANVVNSTITITIGVGGEEGTVFSRIKAGFASANQGVLISGVTEAMYTSLRTVQTATGIVDFGNTDTQGVSVRFYVLPNADQWQGGIILRDVSVDSGNIIAPIADHYSPMVLSRREVPDNTLNASALYQTHVKTRLAQLRGKLFSMKLRIKGEWSQQIVEDLYLLKVLGNVGIATFGDNAESTVPITGNFSDWAIVPNTNLVEV